MSLKAFHLFFIVLSVILAGFVAAWAVGQYRVGGETTYLVTAVLALAASGSLVWYASLFRRKTRSL
jgi:hypothetical protein